MIEDDLTVVFNRFHFEEFIMKNPLLQEVFKTDSTNQKFIVSALEILLGDDKTAEILDDLMPKAPTSQALYKGKPLSYYSGIGRPKLVTMFGLTNDEVDEVFEQLGVTESDDERSAALSEIEELTSGDGKVKPAEATTEMAVSDAVSTPVVKDGEDDESSAEADEESEDDVDAEDAKKFSYVELMKLSREEQQAIAKERGLDFDENAKEQTLASLISKDFAAKGK